MIHHWRSPFDKFDKDLFLTMTAGDSTDSSKFIRSCRCLARQSETAKQLSATKRTEFCPLCYNLCLGILIVSNYEYLMMTMIPNLQLFSRIRLYSCHIWVCLLVYDSFVFLNFDISYMLYICYIIYVIQWPNQEDIVYQNMNMKNI